jgi:simple sugar transport system permease protein
MFEHSDIILALALTVIGAATPLLFAAAGELISERAGVLNLGVEGMLLIGAMSAFAATTLTGSAMLGLLAAALGGMLMALIHAVLSLSLLANQVATGLALTIFGVGLSALLGGAYVGIAIAPLARFPIPVLADTPFIGPLLFNHNLLVYLSVLMVIVIHWFLFHSRAGLILRAVGESPESAHALGYPVIRIRYLAVLFGGLMAGLGGAYLSLVATPMWAENMSAGRGWVALALVVFATWKPWRVMLGAYLFGGVTILQLYAQGFGVAIPSQFLSMLPYLATILVLVLISRDRSKLREHSPASLGKVFRPST